MVIAESTRRLVGNLFELEDLGARPERHWRSCARLGGTAISFSRKPLRGSPRDWSDRACGAGRRTRTAAAPLGEGKEWRRPSGVTFRRAWYRQITTDCCASWNASLPSRILACAISVRRSIPTVHCIRPLATWSVLLVLRTTTLRKRNSTSSTHCWRKPRPLLRRHALCRHAVAAKRWTLSHARPYPQRRRQRTLEALVCQVEALSRSKSTADDF